MVPKGPTHWFERWGGAEILIPVREHASIFRQFLFKCLISKWCVLVAQN